MRFQNLDLNLLVALDVLLEERNVSRAAARLHLSQSAMSGALGRLREFFGDELLVQVGRQMVPTPRAESLAHQVRDILLRIQSAVEAKPSFDPASARRTFRIVTSDYITEVLLADVVRRLKRVAPGISLELIPPGTSTSECLQRGELDFVITPDTHMLDLHPKEILFEETYCCVVWTGNTRVGDALSLEQYLESGHIGVALSRQAPSADQGFLERFGHERRIEVTVPSFCSVPHLLVGTDLVATMHSRLARLYARLLPLRILPLPIEFPTLIEMVQWSRYFESDPGLLWMRELFQACVAEQESRQGP
ncbi:LysR family transcriptional regulator [Archangium violaceum]|uniref:LysR family transcriptional regulator n=1 Tax=Archangium violaceum TaxID=83451 RepID=UPI00193C72FB|nr:LysR family transcriptional regulator [Archangium violaceum]QRK06866.1 LysR family transcriptional regulator [Archangium violaceum]